MLKNKRNLHMREEKIRTLLKSLEKKRLVIKRTYRKNNIIEKVRKGKVIDIQRGNIFTIIEEYNLTLLGKRALQRILMEGN